VLADEELIGTLRGPPLFVPPGGSGGRWAVAERHRTATGSLSPKYV
jgi:hypothetical protein